MEDSQAADSEAEEAVVGSLLHINYLVTRSRSDSHVADTKFDSDDKSSLSNLVPTGSYGLQIVYMKLLKVVFGLKF